MRNTNINTDNTKTGAEIWQQQYAEIRGFKTFDDLADAVNRGEVIPKTEYELDIEAELASERREYEEERIERGAAGMHINLKNGSISTSNKDGLNKQIFKNVSRGTWTKMHNAVIQILTEATID